jgi:hypothetical protein
VKRIFVRSVALIALPVSTCLVGCGTDDAPGGAGGAAGVDAGATGGNGGSDASGGTGTGGAATGGSGGASATGGAAGAGGAPPDAGGADATTDGGGNDARPAGRRVFVTSEAYDGALGGVSGGDAKCQAAANGAGLGGTWLAWLSDTTTSPSARFPQSTEPYVLVGGGQLAADWTDLIDGSLAAPIDRDETGSALADAGAARVWTGTVADGTLSGGNCADWTTVGSGGVYGTAAATDSQWSFTSGNTCGSLDHLYCFES